MKKKSIFTFCLVVVAAVILNYVAFLGLPGDWKKTYGGFTDKETGILQGIDLAGGSVVSFEADYENPTDAQMDTVRAIYEKRLTDKGYTESRISVGEGGKVTIEIPSKELSSDAEGEAKTATSATDDVVELLSSVAKLAFCDSEGNVVVEGTEVKSAQSMYGRAKEGGSMEYYVSLEFTDAGAKAFSDATAAAAAKTAPNNIIQIVMDDKVVSAPQVSGRIDGGQAMITGSFTSEAAQTLASQINSGNLPFEMKKISQETVGAELGENALNYSLIAAGIGVLLIMLFMIWCYRLPGVIASLSLFIYVGLIGLILGATRTNLSLPGIAGIILSIGMAVDADCVIFERMKEELEIGKSIRAGVEAGFKKAFSAILDSNITTIISCVVLYMSGIGTVTGFATTLGIGVILSMFTAIVITKFLLKNLVNFGITNRNLFYKPRKNSERKAFSYTQNKIKFLILPLVIIVVGAVSFVVRGGFNFDVEFAGGIRMQVEMNENVPNDEIADIVKDVTGLDSVVQKSESAGNSVIIKVPAGEDDEANKNKIFEALQEKYDLKNEALISAQSTSPSFGKQVQKIALSYTLIAILCILIYIIIRFDLKSGVMAILALAVNVLVMIAVYAITHIAINTTFIAAMLTVVGYSINNTIVIFDRIRENLKSRNKNESISEMTNRSISEIKGRTVNSTITTLITIVLIYILGVSSIKQFALPLIIGIVIGAYTSIFLASTFWAAWREKSQAKK